MTAVQLRRTLHQRVDRLEERADKHDLMSDQLTEIYTAFKTAKLIFRFFNRLWSKVAAALLALVGFLAAALTVWEKVSALLGHH